MTSMETEFITLSEYHDRIRALYESIIGRPISDEDIAEAAANAIAKSDHNRWTLDKEGQPVLEVPVRR